MRAALSNMTIVSSSSARKYRRLFVNELSASSRGRLRLGGCSSKSATRWSISLILRPMLSKQSSMLEAIVCCMDQGVVQDSRSCMLNVETSLLELILVLYSSAAVWLLNQYPYIDLHYFTCSLCVSRSGFDVTMSRRLRHLFIPNRHTWTAIFCKQTKPWSQTREVRTRGTVHRSSTDCICIQNGDHSQFLMFLLDTNGQHIVFNSKNTFEIHNG